MAYAVRLNCIVSRAFFHYRVEAEIRPLHNCKRVSSQMEKGLFTTATRVTNRHNIRPSGAMISQFCEILYLRGHNSGTTHPILLIIKLGRGIITINIIPKFDVNQKIFV